MTGLPCRFNVLDAGSADVNPTQQNIRKQIWMKICEIDKSKEIKLKKLYNTYLVPLDE